jgi:hypothetical protein
MNTKMNGQTETHPAGGLIQISRVTGYKSLFASEMEHQHCIALRIHQAKTILDGARVSFVNDGPPVVEIRLSASQFAEVITTLNMGMGTPCTIHSVQGERYPEIVSVADRPRFEAEGTKVMSKTLDAIDEALAEIESLRIPAKAKTALRAKIQKAHRLMTDEMPSLVEAYQEHMDRVEERATTEIAAMVDHAVHLHGVEAMRLGRTGLAGAIGHE